MRRDSPAARFDFAGSQGIVRKRERRVSFQRLAGGGAPAKAMRELTPARRPGQELAQWRGDGNQPNSTKGRVRTVAESCYTNLPMRARVIPGLRARTCEKLRLLFWAQLFLTLIGDK